MKKLKSHLWAAAVFVLFLAMALASATPQKTYKPAPRPCITHAPMYNSSLQIAVYISGSYTMKDLSGAQVNGRDLLLQELNGLSYGKFKLSDGTTPDLSFNITINESSGYYGANVNMYVNDGNCKYKYSNGKESRGSGTVYYNFSINYVTAQKLFHDIADKFYNFINYGWCQDCASPCNPY
jgi:hypothetical protein